MSAAETIYTSSLPQDRPSRVVPPLVVDSPGHIVGEVPAGWMWHPQHPVDALIEAASALGHHETLRSSDDDTIRYWKDRVAELRTTLVAAAPEPNDLDVVTCTCGCGLRLCTHCGHDVSKSTAKRHAALKAREE
jgi:hypothetical protein